MVEPPLRVLEFYSGIGGMHYALQRVCPDAVVLDAFDVNHAANTVYAHNFGKAPRQVDLASLTAAALDAYGADLWLMAPPCQPFTRQGKQLGAADARSSSFLHLLQQLQAMRAQPRGLLVENVVGFEGSDVHAQLAAALAACGYHMQEFILTPVQYAVPYSRPRYFCVASKQPLPVPLPGLHQPCLCTPSLLLQLQRQGADAAQLLAAAQQHLASHVQQVPTLGEFLSLSVQHNHQPQQQQQQQQPGNGSTEQPLQPQQHLHQQQQQEVEQACEPPAAPASPSCMHECSWVPDAVLQRHADVVDVVAQSSRSCNCFTKAYGHFARGTGSLLATVPDPSAVDGRWQLVQGSGSLELRGYTPPGARGSNSGNDKDSSGTGPAVVQLSAAAAAAAADATEDVGGSGAGGPASGAGGGGSDELVAGWRQLKLRYFSVGEIAALHSFPPSFSLPPGFGSRQGYQLLGNSLSVAVVADLLAYLLAGQGPAASAG